jgi:protein ImuB
MLWLALKVLPDPGTGQGVGAGTVPLANTAHAAHTPNTADIPGAPASMGSADSTWLGLWALQFSPRVAWVEEAWLLEASTTLRLWGGLSGLQRQLHARFASLDLTCQLQCYPAPSALAALASWRTGTYLNPCAWKLGTLPLHALSAARAHVPVLDRLGLHTWAQLERLPRQGVARRWGPELLQALDQGLGKAPEQHRWLQPPPVFDHTLESPFALETVAALMPAVRQLLAALQGWLSQRQLGALALRWQWTHDSRRDVPTHGKLELHTAHPTQALAHWQRLTEEHLARLQLSAPVLALQLSTLAHAPCPGAHTDWLAPHPQAEGGPDHGLAELLERLTARLGPHAVVRWQPQSSQWPQAQQHAYPAAPDPNTLRSATPRHNTVGPGRDHPSHPASVGTTASWAHTPAHTGSAEPTWLLQHPLPLPMAGHRPHHHGPLELLAGPQRLEWIHWPTTPTGTTTSPATPATPTQAAEVTPVAEYRDYFVARSPQVGLLWVYRCVPTALPQTSTSGTSSSEPVPEANASVGAQWSQSAQSRPSPQPLQSPQWFLHGCFA